MPYDKLRELAHAFATGQGGAQGVTLTTTAPPLINIALPDWAAETFVLALAPLTPVNTPANPNPSPTQLFNPLLQVRVQWGNSKAIQDALLDYPTSGCKVQLSGSQVRVFVEYRNPAVVTPAGPDIVVGATLTPGTRDTAAPPPYFTTPAQLLDHTLVANAVDFPVPPHARAYRLFGVQAPAPTSGLSNWTTLNVSERYGSTAVLVAQDSSFPDAALLIPSEQFRPISPQTSVLRVNPGTATPGTTTSLSAQFAMDIG